MAASIALRGVLFRDCKWRKVMGITQYFPNINLTVQTFYMLRMIFNIDLTCIIGKFLP